MTARALTEGLTEFRAVLAAAERDAAPEAAKVMHRAGNNIKRGAVRRVSGIRRAPHYPRAIGYDLERRGDLIDLAVGPDKDKTQGPLGHFFEYGDARTPAQPHLGPALDEELPNVVKYIGDLGIRLLQ